jgi:hypothetical protein
MGINSNSVRLLTFAKTRGVNFKKTITLGRQHFFASKQDVITQAEKLGLGKEGLDRYDFSEQFSEPFFKFLGSDVIDSIDFSDYEGAKIVFDMNNPLPEHLYNKYSVVFDGGTLEHVFNFPQSIRNCMKMVETGGHFISITPANNQMGHGFYQFSPELFFRIFSPENGFEVVNLFVNTCSPKGKYGSWYEVKDPHKVHGRVLLTNSMETSMMIIARKLADKEIFKNTPQQSDYAETWETKATEEPEQQKQTAVGKSLYKKIVPLSVRDWLWQYRYRLKNKHVSSDDLGSYNPKHFTKFE